MQKLHTLYPGQVYTYGAWVKLYKKWAKGDVLMHTGSKNV